MNKIPIINQIIKAKRKEKKITQLDFSKMINKSLGTVKRYDTGDLIPENTLILICNKFGLNLYELIEAQIIENDSDIDLTGTPFEETGFYYDLIKKYELGIYELKENNEDFKEDVKKIELLYSLFYNSFYHDTDKIFTEKEFKGFVDSCGTIAIKNKTLVENDIKKDVVVDNLDIEEWNFLFNDMERYFNLILFELRKKKLYKK